MSKHTALIVGGTSGIGLATARRLHDRGATVHISRRKERLDTVAATDPELIGHQADCGDRDAIAAVAESIGTIDWLVITLSGREGPGPIADLDLDLLRRAFDAKFWGHVTTIQAALPQLAPTGAITLQGAITARAGMPGTAGITAINGAVEALTLLRASRTLLAASCTFLAASRTFVRANCTFVSGSTSCPRPSRRPGPVPRGWSW